MNISTYLPAITAFVTAILALLIVTPFARRIGLVDRPHSRKKHQGDVPLVGGIATVIAILAASITWPEKTATTYVFLATMASMVALGAIDDRFTLNYKKKFLGQILIVCPMIFALEHNIVTLGDIFGLGDISLWVFAPLFTFIGVIGLTNAFNMIDGIDGLLGCIALVCFGMMGWLFYSNDHQESFIQCITICAALLPFIAFNLLRPHNPYKVFMGDAGSLLLGIAVSWLLISGSQQEPNNAFSPSVGLWVVGFPIIDMIVIMFRRLRKRQSPFEADREHLHHLFLRAGFSAKQTLLILGLLCALIASIGVLLEQLQVHDALVFWGLFCVLLVYGYAIHHAWKFSKALKRFN